MTDKKEVKKDESTNVGSTTGTINSTTGVVATVPAKKKKVPKKELNAAANQTLTIIDNRTGGKYEVQIKNGTIQATALKQMSIRSYDPAYLNTALASSRVRKKNTKAFFFSFIKRRSLKKKMLLFKMKLDYLH